MGVKTNYFTPDTLEIKALDMLREIEPYCRKRAIGFDPARSALFVLDMQRYFLEENSHAHVPSAAAILPGIRALAGAFSTRRLPIVFTRHVNTPQDAGCMGTWWRDLLTDGNPLSEITPELDSSTGNVHRKSQYDAFHGSSLNAWLRDQGVTQIVICGVMTHLCCETTARAAFTHGYEVFFTVDGTATYNEAFHRATLLNLSHGFATVVRVNEILSAIRPDRFPDSSRSAS